MKHNGVVFEGLELEKLRTGSYFLMIDTPEVGHYDNYVATMWIREKDGSLTDLYFGELTECKNPMRVINSKEKFEHMSSEELIEKIEAKIVAFLNKPDLRAEDIKFLGEAWQAMNQVDWMKALVEKPYGYDPNANTCGCLAKEETVNE